MKIKSIAFLAMCILLISCSATPPVELSQEELVFLNAVNSMDTTFTVPAEESEATWIRIQSFIGEFSSMDIKTSSDSVIETFKPDGDNYGYTAARTPLDEKVEFTVNCTCGNMFGNKNAEQNAKCLAYFAKTSEINPAFIVQ
ncbi:MAG: hypothetical protein MUP98_13680 [Candidatus Aminicenantes bacterium]|nr:hypothetical protein [Candidatus Aminicenantes bacterium]